MKCKIADADSTVCNTVQGRAAERCVVRGGLHCSYLFILFPYIPFRYIPWKWKMSQSVYIIRQLAHGITSIAKVEKYL
jgi:hypothetical protein